MIKFQFSIAGVMGLTVVVALGLGLLPYADFLIAHIATTSLLVGGGVGWFVGTCFGQPQRGRIAGVLGALLWTSVAALMDLDYWSHEPRGIVWVCLAA